MDDLNNGTEFDKLLKFVGADTSVSKTELPDTSADIKPSKYIPATTIKAKKIIPPKELPKSTSLPNPEQQVKANQVLEKTKQQIKDDKVNRQKHEKELIEKTKKLYPPCPPCPPCPTCQHHTPSQSSYPYPYPMMMPYPMPMMYPMMTYPPQQQFYSQYQPHQSHQPYQPHQSPYQPYQPHQYQQQNLSSHTPQQSHNESLVALSTMHDQNVKTNLVNTSIMAFDHMDIES